MISNLMKVNRRFSSVVNWKGVTINATKGVNPVIKKDDEFLFDSSELSDSEVNDTHDSNLAREGSKFDQFGTI